MGPRHPVPMNVYIIQMTLSWALYVHIIPMVLNMYIYIHVYIVPMVLNMYIYICIYYTNGP